VGSGRLRHTYSSLRCFRCAVHSPEIRHVPFAQGMLPEVEPVTHLLTGACLSRACGFPARVRYATFACVIAAELPDADYIYRLGGPLQYFQHHRGWTHALWSLPLQAALITVAFYAVHRTRHIWKKHRSVEEPAPARWLLLWLMALVASCSHVFLDWTNNYGVRPFAPFFPEWFSGELFFIVEPVLLFALALALVLPLVFSLVHREIGIRRPRYQGRGLAIAALAVMGLMLAQRAMAHDDALVLTRAQQLRGGPVLRASASPYPVISDKWHAVVETPANVQAGTVNLSTNTFDTDSQEIHPKVPDTPRIAAAKRSWLGRVYLDWSTFPSIVDAGPAALAHPEMTLSTADAAAHVVRFSDLRYKYDTMAMRGSSGKVPLGAEVWIDDQMKVLRIYMGDTRQALPR
jgi:inner membrane protein